MKNTKANVLVYIILFIGCQMSLPEKDQFTSIPRSCISGEARIASANQQWGCFINNNELNITN